MKPVTTVCRRYLILDFYERVVLCLEKPGSRLKIPQARPTHTRKPNKLRRS